MRDGVRLPHRREVDLAHVEVTHEWHHRRERALADLAAERECRGIQMHAEIRMPDGLGERGRLRRRVHEVALVARRVRLDT